VAFSFGIRYAELNILEKALVRMMTPENINVSIVKYGNFAIR
jgi:hypothetical protein